ncbi:hypothetical protein KO361_00425 [Candidatus Woesearchaeota archaeon]|nr:hypothetical protein [Candidatus Woesearchaeota archaeon]
MPIILIISFVIGYSIYHFIAKFLFKGKATGAQYFRSLSNCFILYWFAFIPVIGVFLQYIIGLWILGLNVFVLMKVHKLAAWKAVLVLLIPIILLLILGFGSLYGAMSPSYMVPPNA